MKYVLVTEEMFFEDYNNKSEYGWQNGLSIKYEREKKWDEFIKVNGESYYDMRYILRNFEEKFDRLTDELNELQLKYNQIKDRAQDVQSQENNLKQFLEQCKEVDIKDNK